MLVDAAVDDCSTIDGYTDRSTLEVQVHEDGKRGEHPRPRVGGRDRRPHKPCGSDPIGKTESGELLVRLLRKAEQDGANKKKLFHPFHTEKRQRDKRERRLSRVLVHAHGVSD